MKTTAHPTIPEREIEKGIAMTMASTGNQRRIRPR